MKLLNKLIKTWYQIRLHNKLISNTQPSEPDNRDYVLKTTKKSIPTNHTIIHDIPIRDQKNIGSCMSFAAIRAIEIQISNQQKTFIEGSELFHYYMVRKYINNTFPEDKGMVVRDGCKCLISYGFCPEKLWQYEVKDYNKTPNSFANSFAELIKNFVKIKAYYRLNSVEDIKTAISKNIPVVFGLRIDANYLKCKGEWIPGGASYGGHAQIITKYDDEYFYIDNSWGKRWGLSGKYFAKIETIMNKGFDFFCIELEK